MPAEVTFRPAVAADLPTILALLADDDIARSRDTHPATPSPPDHVPSGGFQPARASGASGASPPRAGLGLKPMRGGHEDQPAQSGHGAEPVPDAVRAGFAAIEADPRNELVVADEGGAVVGTCQLTFIPGLSRGGAERMTIEAVRVRADRRGAGIGRRMMAYALGRAKQRGCALAQLTTDKRRLEAHRFYESLGFTASHEGMKLAL